MSDIELKARSLNHSTTLKKLQNMEENKLQEQLTNEYAPIDPKLKIYGVRIEEVEFTVEDKFTNTYKDLGVTIHGLLTQDFETTKVLLMKDEENNTVEIEADRADLFHATAMIIQYHKDREKAIKEYNRLAEFRVNKITHLVRKVEKRRNKKKLNKKFAK